ncbi:ubiquitin carboxyl-terminal hydrolase isozyme L3-like [Atheta coriaria]|uniref:ubiquitin carboxyl-terminal hydrolase isozyme L3-like n=1 Tax=Dalotia coriaria TaxID=877792 RepID=UPI0031F3D4AC
MNKFLQMLGVSSEWKVVDVFGLDDECLAWVPKPVLSVILLFPCSEKYHEFATQEQKEIEERGQTVSDSIYYIKQLVSNACGTIALLHCVANNSDKLQVTNENFKKLLEESMTLSPLERGQKLQAVAAGIQDMHQELAQEGQTELNPNEQVNHHFIAFVHKDGDLYELDGRKEFPINHGKTTPETLLEDAARVCKQFVARDSEDVNFTVMALTAAEN